MKLDYRNIATMIAAQNEAQVKGWYSARNVDRDEDEVFIYGVIGGSFFDEGIEPGEFVRDLRALRGNKLTIRINSPGGSIDAAKAIRTHLREHDAEKTTIVDAAAYSAASWVGLGDWPLMMAPQARMMIHEPRAIAIGSPQDFRDAADVLDAFGDDIADMLADRAGETRNAWRERMRAETWYSDQGAVDAGLADGIVGKSTEPGNTFSSNILTLFRNTPKELRNEPTKRDAESALRDAGFSRDEAKRLVSQGWDALEGADPREAEALSNLARSLRAS